MIADFDGLREVVHFQDGLMCTCYPNREAEDYPPHWHSDIEIITPIENGYTVKIDDQQYILQEGEILIIPPGVIHELFAPEGGIRLILQISYALTSEMTGFYGALQQFYPCIHIKPQGNEGLHHQLLSILQVMEKEYRSRQPFHGDMLTALSQQFLVLLSRSSQMQAGRENCRRYAKSVDGFLRVCDYIHHHCAEPLSVSLLSEVAGYSKSHFLRMFKEFSNISCGEYIQQQRVALAKQLLADPERNITDIVTRAGFGSVASFNRVFKEQMDCTPTQYRKILRGQNRNI